MKPESFLIDTHALFWHWSKPDLSPARVVEIFRKADSGNACLIVSHIVLLELFYIFRKFGMAEDFRGRLAAVCATTSFQIEPVLLEDINALPDFESVPEMHDRILVIQASRLGICVVTKDESIQKSKRVDCIWN